MLRTKKQQPVKLIIGLIFKENEARDLATLILEKKLGKIDFQSPALSFNHTAYYEKEFGKDLKRQFISFKKLIPASNLSRIKVFTNGIEKKLSNGPNRSINLDPGYLDLSKLVLASIKNYKHRIYLDKGIFAEVTLFYQGESFRPWEWTYPDYKTDEYIAIFNKIREIYSEQIKDQ